MNVDATIGQPVGMSEPLCMPRKRVADVSTSAKASKSGLRQDVAAKSGSTRAALASRSSTQRQREVAKVPHQTGTNHSKQVGDKTNHPAGTLKPISHTIHGGHRLEPEAVAAFQTIQHDAETSQSRAEIGQFTVTAYALTAQSTGKSPGMPGFGITASGSRASVGRTVAVDPDVIPIGSLIYIDLPGIGWRLAEDTGGAIKGNHIDLLLPSDATAIKFGVKHRVHVYALSR